jgi:hypothetical protein
MPALRTTTTCRDCGNPIPESLVAEAQCVLCRYPATKKATEHLDGDGKPVPTEFDVAADAHAVKIHFSPADETFEDALLGEGFDAMDSQLAAKIHADFLTRFANRRAAEIVRMILARMAQTKTAKNAEFRAFLAIFSPDRTLEEIAAEAGMSRQKIHFHVQKLRPILTGSALV